MTRQLQKKLEVYDYALDKECQRLEDEAFKKQVIRALLKALKE